MVAAACADIPIHVLDEVRNALTIKCEGHESLGENVLRSIRRYSDGSDRTLNKLTLAGDAPLRIQSPAKSFSRAAYQLTNARGNLIGRCGAVPKSMRVCPIERSYATILKRCFISKLESATFP